MSCNDWSKSYKYLVQLITKSVIDNYLIMRFGFLYKFINLLHCANWTKLTKIKKGVLRDKVKKKLMFSNILW